MSRFSEITDRYELFVESCYVKADESKAFVVFKNGKKKEFRSPDEMSRYIKRHFGVIDID